MNEEKVRYFKGKYYISFYREEDDDERFYIGFNNLLEICRYKKMEVNSTNINIINKSLYKALNNNRDHYTKLIDNIPLKVYLVDMSDEIEENERREKEMKEFVKISSNVTIEVYPDLSAIDTTNQAAQLADKLNAKPNWVYPILIKEGIHYYPVEIKNWKAVKALSKKRVLSIAEEVEEVPEDEKVMCMEMKKKMARVLARTGVKKETKRTNTETVA